MRVVIDTNVLISGIFFGGPPAQILKAWQAGDLQFVFSREILDEYFAVCDRFALRYPEIDISNILMLLAQNSLIVEAQPLPEPVSCDPDDDKFLACALACDTRIIISGDRDLITVSGYNNVEVVTPREFVDDNFT